MKKILSLALAVLLVLGLFAGCGEEEKPGTSGGAAQATKETESTPRELVILYTNDVHNAYAMAGTDEEKPDAIFPMGYAALAAYAGQLRDDGKEVLLIDGGDHLQGDAVRLSGGHDEPGGL